MNKLIILLLVVCLVSVHAYVKRDAPAPEQQDIIGDVKKLLDKGIEEAKSHLNPDALKKSFGEAVDSFNNALENLKSAEAPKA